MGVTFKVDERTAGLGSTIGGLGVKVGSSVGKTCFGLQAWRLRRTRIMRASRFGMISFPEALKFKHPFAFFIID